MIYALVFVAGIFAPYIAWFIYGVLHDYVYMPLWWIPRHIKACNKLAKERWELSEGYEDLPFVNKPKTRKCNTLGCNGDTYCIYCLSK